MRIRMIPILLAIIIIIIPLGVLGAVAGLTATYVQEPYLQFKKGGDGDPYLDTQLVGLLGTMTVNCENPPAEMKEPSLVDSTTSTNFWFEGLFDWNPQNPNTTWEMETTEFYWDTVLLVNGNLWEKRRQSEPSGFAKLTSNSATISNISTFVVKIYLRAHHSADKYKPGAEFTLKTGGIGTFNFAVAPESTNINDVRLYISVNDQEIPPVGSPPVAGGTSYPPTSPPIPIVGSGGNVTTLPSVPYVDDEHPLQVLQYLLSIINERTIDLSDAYGSNRTNVAKARIDLVNATSGTNYKVDIKFESNSVYQGKFHLHLDGDLNQYGIPYYLFFKQETVVPGANIRWAQILNHPERVIKVTGVIQDDAERAPAGTYRDTITVTITAVD